MPLLMLIRPEEQRSVGALRHFVHQAATRQRQPFDQTVNQRGHDGEQGENRRAAGCEHGDSFSASGNAQESLPRDCVNLMAGRCPSAPTARRTPL